MNIDNVPAMTADGEVYTAQKKMQIVVEDQAQYLLTWHHMLALVLNLNSLYDVKLMMWIGKNVNYNDNTISLNKFYKKRLMEETKAGRSTVEKSIASLAEKGFLVKDETCVRCGMYHVNPSYIWHGTTDARDKKLKTVLELIQYQHLPDKERQIEDDIRRYMEHDKKQRAGSKKQSKTETKGHKNETKTKTEQKSESVLQDEIDKLYKQKDPEQV